MRRQKRENTQNNNSKTMIMYIGGTILIIAMIALIIFLMTDLFSTEDTKVSKTNNEKISSIIQDESNSTTVSTQIGKSVEEATNQLKENVVNQNTTKSTTENKSTKTTTTTKKEEQTKQEEQTSKEERPKQEKTVINNTEKLTFAKPVEGEISKEYAKDSLLYSETLEEWITHFGVDIKADKTTIVKASADGTIKSIKTDPRYGLTVIIEHANGYQTLYANLLTAEFVKVGEVVKQGQTIGTVGTTAIFEVADGPHLHFEIKKEDENVDPSLYIE